ncbi:hypothetical protein ACHAPJ_007434 [Fusarium lateritium]
MTSTFRPDPYNILGVSQDAQLPEICSAYRKFVIENRLRKVQGWTREFQQANRAYALLRDEEARKHYNNQVRRIEPSSAIHTEAYSRYMDCFESDSEDEYECARQECQSHNSSKKSSREALSDLDTGGIPSDLHHKKKTALCGGTHEEESREPHVIFTRVTGSYPDKDTKTDTDTDPDSDPDIFAVRSGVHHEKESALRGGTDEEESRQVDIELPLILAGQRIMTTPDTGSDCNVMSAQIAKQLGLGFEGDPPHDIFKLANGRAILCKGKVSTCFVFPFEDTPALPIVFHILEPLAASAIIGRAFLDATDTLTTHINRLVRTSHPFGMPLSPPRILHLSSPRRTLQCYINSTPVRANADTGAEMNLASSEFVARAGLRPQLPDHRHQYVQLADGSIVPISGCFRARFNPSEKPSPETMRPRAHMKTFYVLDGLTTDVLLGRDLLFEIYAFVEQANAFIEIKCPDLYADLNLIAWLERWRSGSSSHSVSRTSCEFFLPSIFAPESLQTT